MERFNEKTFLKTGIIDELKQKIFYSKSKAYLFDYWYYDKGVYLFAFKEEANPEKIAAIQLYYQHLDNFKNTTNLIYQFFDKVA